MAKNAIDYLGLRVVEASGTPLYKQIYDRIRAAIEIGSLPPGTKLPSSRDLACQLATARGTVKTAYDILAGDGFVVSRGAVGTVVANRDGLSKIAWSEERRPADHPAAAIPVHADTPARLQVGVPALDAFPAKLWARLNARHSRTSLDGPFRCDPAGDMRLRKAISNYLAIARGVVCRREQIFVTVGFQGALGLLSRVILRQGDTIWVEDPGYARARNALAMSGLQIMPVPVDQYGINVTAGTVMYPKAQAALVTPSHQAPLGMPLSLERRKSLLSWANSANAWVIEDDYYSEFWFRERQLPALKNLDTDDRVLYVGTFSKALLPRLRLGYLVVPQSLVDTFARTVDLLAPMHSPIEQSATADMIEQGHFSRHIKKMRNLYAARREAFATALSKHFGSRICVDIQPGGMHLVMRLPRCQSDVDLAQKAAKFGFGVSPLSQWYMSDAEQSGLVVSFANVPADKADAEVLALAEALQL